jgi:two-component system phosphate regulon response regulator PhoB
MALTCHRPVKVMSHLCLVFGELTVSRVCIVTASAEWAELIASSLKHEGHDAFLSRNLAPVGEVLEDAGADLLLLDLAMPALVRSVRAWSRRTGLRLPAILGLQTSGTERVVEQLRALGVADFLPWPFAWQVLLERIKFAMMMTTPEGLDCPIELADLHLDPRSRRVLAGGQDIHLGPTEFRLLHFLLAHPDRVHTRERLVERLWGLRDKVAERTVDVHVKRLRQALTPALRQARVETVRGAGYRLCVRNLHEPPRPLA